MKRIVETFHFDAEKLDSQGFKTEQQKRAIACVGDLVGEIQKSNGPFGMLLMFISEADLLQNHPVTTWSNLTDKAKRDMFEDYMLKRLALLAAQGRDDV